MTDAVSLLNVLVAPPAAGTAARPAADGGFVAMVSGRPAAFEQAGGQSGSEGGADDPLRTLVNLLGRLRSRASALLRAASGADPAETRAAPAAAPETGRPAQDPGKSPAQALADMLQGLQDAGDVPQDVQALIALLTGTAAPQAAETGTTPAEVLMKVLSALLAEEAGAASAPETDAGPEAVQRLVKMLSAQTAKTEGPDAGSDAMRDLIAALAGAQTAVAELVETAAPRRSEAGTDAVDRSELLRDQSEVLETVAGMASALAAALARFERDTGAGLIAVLKSGQPDPADGASAGATGARGVMAGSGAGSGASSGAGGAVAALQLFLSVTDRVERGLRALPAVHAAKAANRNAPSGSVPPLAEMPLTAIAGQAMPAARTPSAVPSAESGPSPAAEPGLVPGPQSAVAGLPTAVADVPDAGLRSEDPSVQSLLRQIAAAASLSMRASGSAAPGAAPMPAEGTRGRAEPLLAPDDILRALSTTDLSGRQPERSDAAPRSAEPAQEAPRFAAALTAQIRAAEVSEGRTRIELSPRGLGSIEVDVRTEADGTLKVVVRAENQAVLNSLREERDLLAQAIGRADGGSLDFQTFSQEPGSGGDDDRAKSGHQTAAEHETVAPAGQPTAPAAIGDGRLDIMT